jgi:hypothetical protein
MRRLLAREAAYYRFYFLQLYQQRYPRLFQRINALDCSKVGYHTDAGLVKGLKGHQVNLTNMPLHETQFYYLAAF